MTVWNGPPNYKSLAGTYTLGAGTTITIDSSEPKPIEVNKYDIPVGALVFVKTKNYYNSFFSSAGWSSYTIPTLTGTRPNITTPSPTWVINPSVTTPVYGGGYTIGGGTTITPTTPYVVDSGTGAEIEFDTSTEIQDELMKLYDAYVSDIESKNGSGGTGTGGSGLGMAMMGGNPKNTSKKKKTKTANKQSKAGTYINTTGTANLNFPTTSTISISANTNCITTGGYYTISSPTSPTFPEIPDYQVKGFKSIKDYMSGQRPVYVTQQDGSTEEELHEIFNKNGKYPEIGKPFHGIVVDKFVPRITTEQGEVVDLQTPRLYKVLINENNCLWVDETVLAPMKPEVCPLKEGFNEEETDND